MVFALIEAEEYGITQANVDQMKATARTRSCSASSARSEDTGKLLGLDKDWAYRAIKAVGNYGEIFERNVGPKTAAQPAARRQQPVEQGRPHVRAAGALTSCCALAPRPTTLHGRAPSGAGRGASASWSLAQPRRCAAWLYQAAWPLRRRRCAVVWFLAHNTLRNMRVRGIQSGFDFLAQPAGFDIGETLIRVRRRPTPTGRRSWSAC